jgi:hypothetical protein
LEITMNSARKNFATRLQGRRHRGVRNWVPITDPWIGTGDHRLWQREDGYDFDWSSTDPWTRRITQS